VVEINISGINVSKDFAHHFGNSTFNDIENIVKQYFISLDMKKKNPECLKSLYAQ
jgi:hypothetical protein